MADHQFNEGKIDVKSNIANILMWWKLHAMTPDVAVVIPLNNPVGPADDTVTAE